MTLRFFFRGRPSSLSTAGAGAIGSPTSRRGRSRPASVVTSRRGTGVSVLRKSILPSTRGPRMPSNDGKGGGSGALVTTGGGAGTVSGAGGDGGSGGTASTTGSGISGGAGVAGGAVGGGSGSAHGSGAAKDSKDS